MASYPVGDMTGKRNSFQDGKLMRRQRLGTCTPMLLNNWRNSRKMSINYDSLSCKYRLVLSDIWLEYYFFYRIDNYTESMKKTQKGSTKNLSHRYLIKQKTKQLFYYPAAKPKPNSTIIIGLQTVDLNNSQSKKLKTVSNDDHQTSICLDDGISKNCSSDKAKHSKDSKSIIKSEKDVKEKYKRSFRSKLMSYKSVETIPKVKNLNIKDQLSRIGPSKQTLMKKQTKSMQNLQNQQVEVIKKQQSRNKTEIKSECTVKQSNPNIKSKLQKQSVSKMRPKVVDPFQKLTKLQEQFENESIINRIENTSMISTQNQEQFRQLLNKIL